MDLKVKDVAELLNVSEKDYPPLALTAANFLPNRLNTTDPFQP